MLEELKNDIEKTQALQSLLLARATGSVEGAAAYQILRTYFIQNSSWQDLIPGFVRTNRTLDQFWQFIKEKFSSYAERRTYIWQEFGPLIEYLEGKGRRPLDQQTSEALKTFDENGVHAVWQKALERRASDPEGAITAARTLLETVCKHILDHAGVSYDASKIELHELYKLTATELKISPSQHTEEVFRQILGGCSAVVNGLGTLRNRLGDAHGKGQRPVKPAPRHAELAVNLAGAMALFLVSTWQAKNET
jgi:hypothetical protein